MILQYLSEFQQDPIATTLFIGIIIIAIVVAVTIHEFSHAIVADQLGDFTARKLGRLTLKPSAHLDPMGSIIFLVAGFGWGKPVPVVQNNIKKLNPQIGLALISLVGPGSNFIFSLLLAILIRFELIPNSVLNIDLVASFIFILINVNILLCVFNLLPLPPLDGFKVILGILPSRFSNSLSQMERYGAIPLFGMLILDMTFNSINIFGTLIGTPVGFTLELMLDITGRV
ncbi:MAG: site-2 protease family protein [SAR202 cluster bacterium]|jgi:Zn-dependent protease|nr:MAG: site-2 protease family protein [SAR202 cluster bacterium]MQG74713.1 site-2 protease family protein [SAR202 cluster bacterium]|tara:strand:- start:397 stop:1083 length:687 start_codon:yes stop_codon:yes gene_type:complete